MWMMDEMMAEALQGSRLKPAGSISGALSTS
jgi:hypothetical protein